MTWPSPETVERAAEVMHDAYEAAAVGAGWETQAASRKPWSGVPEANKVTMRAAVSALLDHLDAVRPDVDALVEAAERRGRVAGMRETERAWQINGWADVLIPMPTHGDPSLAAGQAVTEWLRARADEEASRGA